MNDQQINMNQTQNTTAPNAQTPAKQSISSTNNSIPPLSSEKNKNQQKNSNTLFSIIAIFLFILILGELVFVFLYHRSYFKNTLQFPLSILSLGGNNNNSNNINPSVIQPTPPEIISNAIVPVPTGQQVINGTGAASGFTVHVEKVTEAPTDISGDKPLKGFQYIEFDVSVTNNTNNTTLIPGMFYFQNGTAGKLFLPADMFGYLNDSRIISALSQKEVTISGKQSLYATDIKPGQTVTRYLIYQILPGEKGQLIWDDSHSLTAVSPGEKVAQKNILAQTQQGKLPVPLQYTTYNSGHSNKITVFSFE